VILDRVVERYTRVARPLRIDPNSFCFTAILGVFAGLPPLSIDLSAPTLPLLPAMLSTSETVAGLTLSLFMVGFALGQLAAGGLSDERGRRPVLLYGLSCFALSGLACALAPSGVILVLARLVQGFGAGACSVIAFAMVQDLFEGNVARTKRSYMATIFTATPILAPALGSVLINLFGWRSVHGVLAVLGVIMLLVTWFFVSESRNAASIAHRSAEQTPIRLHHDVQFVRITLANALSYAVIFVYIAGSPMVIIGKLEYPPTVFASVFACTAIALSLGAWTNGRLSRRGVAAAVLIKPAFVGTIAATVLLALAGLTRTTPGLVVLPPLLMAVMFARGILAPNLQHLAIERCGERAGTASAVVGVSQLASAAGASAVVAAMLPAFGLNAVSVAMALLAAAALAAWRWLEP
jgi:MFS transporter, DHA1 family, multidrug resistance protein